MPPTSEFNLFLNKVAQFVKLATSEISSLQEDRVQLRKKEAADSRQKEKFISAIEKASRTLYDTDFLTDELERKRFIKRASEDPSYLASVIERVCNAADVSLIGSPARVAAKSKMGEEWDPIKAKAFGLNQFSNGILDDI